ncbi:glutaredoxin family protein [Allofustis seminis]|uniref:glutaredoxin family protein n=1 Tax=Allofustis seminis TaxID=166939 RepID=UPI000360C884|nr:glutaredoxin [Allofustis seminis]
MKMLKVYSKDQCGQCQLLKQWLKLKAVDFEEVNISQDENARQEILESGRKSLPQVMVDGQFIDFNEFNDILSYL